MGDIQFGGVLSIRSLALLTIFIFSGFAALIYEQTWLRIIGSNIGFTAESDAIVLGIFFGGLGIGYLIAGRHGRQSGNEIQWYGLLELGIGVYAFFMPQTIGWFVFGIGHGLDVAPALRSAIQYLLVAILMIPPTVALGMTLPYFITGASHLRDFKLPQGVSYFANLFGAALGLIIGITILIPTLGITMSNSVAAMFSIFSGVVALVIFRGSKQKPELPVVEQETTLSVKILTAIAVGGFTVGALEVLVLRCFALISHNSSYAFAIVIFMFLLFLSFGSLLSGFLKKTAFTLPTVIVSVSFLTILGAILFFEVTQLRYVSPESNLGFYLLKLFAMAAILFGPVVMVLGTLLPFAWRMVKSSSQADTRVIGYLSAVSTFGAALGSLAMGFGLIPWAGLWPSFGALAFVAILICVIVCWNYISRAWLITLSVIAVTVQVTIIEVAINRLSDSRDGIALFEGASAYGWIDVIETKDSERQLRQNIHYTMGSSSSRDMEVRQGLLPMLFSTHPERMLFVGLGTGITAGSALVSDDVSIDVVELIPDVVNAARYFRSENKDLLKSPRVNVVVDDARSFLLRSSDSYDVIVSDLFVPWESKTGYLYSEAFYSLAKKHLRDEGVFCQWLGYWQVTKSQFEIIVNTIAKVFPNVFLVWGRIQDDKSLVGIMGTRRELEIDHENALRRVASWDLSNDAYFRSPIPLNDLYIGDWKYDPAKRINTDDHPIIEFGSSYESPTLQNRLVFQNLQKYFAETMKNLPRRNVKFSTGQTKVQDWARIARSWQVQMIAASHRASSGSP